MRTFSKADLQALALIYDELNRENLDETRRRAIPYTWQQLFDFVMEQVGACAMEASAVANYLKNVTTFDEYKNVMSKKEF